MATGEEIINFAILSLKNLNLFKYTIMKITFILPHAGLAGGIRVVAIYAEMLQRRGHEVSVVSVPKAVPNWQSKLKSLVKGRGWPAHPLKKGSHFDGVDVPHRVLESFRPIVDDDVPDGDVVIATWWLTAEWVANLSKSKGAKAYFVQHHELHNYLPIKRVKATYTLPLHKITIAQWLVDLMASEYGDCNVDLVPNSVDLQQFSAAPRSKQANPTVGIMYSTIDWKGCDLSLKAFDLAARQIPNLQLVAFGKHQPTADLPLPAGAKFIYQPAQDTIKDIYASCDAWLFGSRVEGFGLPILEAMACRTPVIGTPVGAAPELLAEGAGIIVPPEDPAAMAQAIAGIDKLSAAQWRSMSDLAYSVATDYTWENAADLFESALHHTINSRRKIACV